MKKLFFKSSLYVILLLLSLEVWVRVFHLHKDHPHRFLDEHQVEKWVPNQEGHGVTGNRRQNFSKYYINNSGYNSYREFDPKADKIELALVGDSFIEGFHQNYYNSIGKKIEAQVRDIEVYEYGYAGYDMADQLHLIHQYKEQFDLIDQVVLGIKFSNDLSRGKYEVQQARIALESSSMRLLKKSKLIVYARSIGALDPPQIMLGRILALLKGRIGKTSTLASPEKDEEHKKEQEYIKNFESLITLYGYDKNRFTLMLDSSITSPLFIDYLNNNNFRYFDLAPALKASKRPTTLVYDRHWNNNGREIVAKVISNYYLGLKK